MNRISGLSNSSTALSIAKASIRTPFFFCSDAEMLGLRKWKCRRSREEKWTNLKKVFEELIRHEVGRESLRESLQARLPRNREGLFCDEFVSVIREAVFAAVEGTSSLGVEELERKLTGVFEDLEGGVEHVNYEAFVQYVQSWRTFARDKEAAFRCKQASSGVIKNITDTSVVKFVPEIEKYLIGGSSLAVFDAEISQARILRAFDADPNAPVICDVEYIPFLSAAVVVGLDKSCTLFDINTGAKLFSIGFPDMTSICSFDRSTSLLFVGVTKSPTISIFQMREHRSKDEKFVLHGTWTNQSGRVPTRILPLASRGLVATTMNDTLILLQNHQGEIVLEQHTTQAVSVLQYSAPTNSLIWACIDGTIAIRHLTSASTLFLRDSVKTPDGSLPPHSVAIACISDVCLATLGSDGGVQLWDLRSLQNYETFQPSHLKEDDHWLHIGSEREAIVTLFSKKCFDTFVAVRQEHEQEHIDDSGSPRETSEDLPLVGMAYNQANQTVLTATERTVKIWDPFCGKLQSRCPRLSVSTLAITSICVADKGKSFFLGFREGQVSSHTMNGTLLKVYVEEGKGSEVLFLRYLEGLNGFAAITWDGLKIYFEHLRSDTAPPTFVPDVSRATDVKCLHFDPVFRLLCLGDRRGQAVIWEACRQHLTTESVRAVGTVEYGRAEVELTHILAGYPAVLVSDNSGNVHFFTISPHPYPHRKFASLVTKGEVRHLSWYPPKKILYVGFVDGTIAAYDCAAALASVKIYRSSLSWEEVMETVGREGTAPESITLVDHFTSVKAHQGAMAGLCCLQSTAIVVSAGHDRQVVAWTLDLRKRGYFLASSIQGEYSAPFVRHSVETYFKGPVPGDNVILRPTVSAPVLKKESAKRRGILTWHNEDDIYRLQQQLAAEKNDVNKSQSHSAARELLNIGNDLDASTPSLPTRKTIEPAPLGRDKDAKEKYTFSPNSCGSTCHSALSLYPDPRLFRRKKHVVDRRIEEEDTGSSFRVTMDFPLPPGTKAERDFQLRTMKDQEESVLKAQEMQSRELGIDLQKLSIEERPTSKDSRTVVSHQAIKRIGSPSTPQTPGGKRATSVTLRSLLPGELLQLREGKKRAPTPLDRARNDSLRPHHVESVEWGHRATTPSYRRPQLARGELDSQTFACRPLNQYFSSLRPREKPL